MTTSLTTSELTAIWLDISSAKKLTKSKGKKHLATIQQHRGMCGLTFTEVVKTLLAKSQFDEIERVFQFLIDYDCESAIYDSPLPTNDVLQDVFDTAVAKSRAGCALQALLLVRSITQQTVFSCWTVLGMLVREETLAEKLSQQFKQQTMCQVALCLCIVLIQHSPYYELAANRDLIAALIVFIAEFGLSGEAVVATTTLNTKFAMQLEYEMHNFAARKLLVEAIADITSVQLGILQERAIQDEQEDNIELETLLD